MLATADPNRVLKVFHAPSRSQILLDCYAMSRTMRHWAKQDRFGDQGRLDDKDPVIVATLLHRRCCRAWVFYNRPFVVPTATRVWAAASAAHLVAEVAVEAAIAMPGHRLAELDRQLEAIRARAGLAVDEEFGDEEPTDRRQAEAEWESAYQQVVDAAFVAVLRRYDMGAVGRLYRKNRSRFDQLFEQGRRQRPCNH